MELVDQEQLNPQRQEPFQALPGDRNPPAGRPVRELGVAEHDNCVRPALADLPTTKCMYGQGDMSLTVEVPSYMREDLEQADPPPESVVEARLPHEALLLEACHRRTCPDSHALKAPECEGVQPIAEVLHKAGRVRHLAANTVIKTRTADD